MNFWVFASPTCGSFASSSYTTVTDRFARRLPFVLRYRSEERFIELPSSAYTLVNGSSCPIFIALPAVAAAVAAEELALPPVEPDGAQAARAAADADTRNARREIR